MQNQSLQIPMPSRPVLVEPSPSVAKSGINTSKNSLTMKSTHNSDSIVRATAVAAGARIVSPSDAASLLKAAQTKNAIHIKSKGTLIKSPVLGNAAMRSDARPSVHYISTGKTATPGSNFVGGSKPTMVGNNPMKAVSPKVLHNRSTALLKNAPSDQISPATESPSKQEVQSSEECKIPEPIVTAKKESREDEAVIRDISVASQRSDGELGRLSTCIETHNTSLNMDIDENDLKAACSKQVEMKTKQMMSRLGDDRT